MISEKEITKGKEVPEELKANLAILLERVNKLRALWGKPMTITSGFRSHDDQIRVYADKGITDESKIPWGSAHLKCAAVDIYDPDMSLTNWCKENNDKVLIDCELWCEDDMATPRLHCQIYPPHSNQRWFKP